MNQSAIDVINYFGGLHKKMINCMSSHFYILIDFESLLCAYCVYTIHTHTHTLL